MWGFSRVTVEDPTSGPSNTYAYLWAVFCSGDALKKKQNHSPAVPWAETSVAGFLSIPGLWVQGLRSGQVGLATPT